MALRTCLFLGFLLVGCQGTSGAYTVGKSTKHLDARQPMPLQKIRFYEAGVSYFERSVTPSCKSPSALMVPEPHLEDALDTLVVFSGTRASAPQLLFGTPGAAEREREEAELPGTRDLIKYENLLASLEGDEIEFSARSGRREGRLVRVGLAPPVPLSNPAPDEPKFEASSMDDLYLLIAGTDGVERVRASEAAPILPKDPARRALLDRAVKAAWSDGEPPLVRLNLAGGEGALRIGYVAETPPFVASYRLALPAAGAEAELSASALVRNETDETWRKVPVSFESLRPGPFGSAPRAPRAKARPTPPGSFEYAAREAVTVGPHGSALVPFLHARIEAKPRVWFSAPRTPGRRAVRVVNATAQTFPEGNVALFAAHGFAGEAALPRLVPEGSALLPFAEELDVGVELTANAEHKQALAATFDGFELEVRAREVHSRSYSISNRRAEPVSIEIGLGFRTPIRAQGFDGVAGEEDNRNGVVEVPGKQTATRAVSIETEITSTTAVEDLTAEPLRVFAESPALSERVRAALRKAGALTARIAKNTELSSLAEQRASELESEAATARGDLSTLGKESSAAAAPLVARLVAFEREHERSLERARSLTAENAKLVETVRRELGALPKRETSPTNGS
jgi:hypothetical protein